MSESCSRALAGAWLKAHLPNVAFQPWSAHVFSRRACVMMAASVRPNTLQLNKYIKTRAITINSASSGRSRLLFATKTRFVHFGWTRVCDQHPFVKKHQKNICSKIMKKRMRRKPEPACTIPILFVFLDIYASCTPNAPLQATSQRRKTIDNHSAKWQVKPWTRRCRIEPQN